MSSTKTTGTAGLRISRYSSSEGHIIAIEITDSASHVAFAEIEMTCEDFAKAVTGMDGMTGDLTTRRLDLVGKRREHKRELVPFDGRCATGPMTDEERAALAPFQVDGWKARLDDLRNGHRRTRHGDGWAHRVSFVRYVED